MQKSLENVGREIIAEYLTASCAITTDNNSRIYQISTRNKIKLKYFFYVHIVFTIHTDPLAVHYVHHTVGLFDHERTWPGARQPVELGPSSKG